MNELNKDNTEGGTHVELSTSEVPVMKVDKEFKDTFYVKNNFPDKVQFLTNADPLINDEVRDFVKLVMLDGMINKSSKETLYKGLEEDTKKIPTYQIIFSRITTLDLPISFTPTAYLALDILCRGMPGKMIVSLIDCLTKYEGETVTLNQIINLYPFGFYNSKVLKDYIDNFIKQKAVKWSEIY